VRNAEIVKNGRITVTTTKILGLMFYDQPLLPYYMFRSHKDHHQAVLHIVIHNRMHTVKAEIVYV
jgi:hypothetical protein